jgi:hypothetical protein
MQDETSVTIPSFLSRGNPSEAPPADPLFTRAQEAMPGLRTILPEFRSIIANGLPVIPAVGEALGVPTHVIRWMAKLNSSAYCSDEFKRQAQWLAAFPAHYRPDPSDRVAVETMMRCRTIATDLASMTGQPLYAIVRGYQGEWSRLQTDADLTKIERYFEPARLDRIHALTRDVHRSLIVPAAMNRLRQAGIVVNESLVNLAEPPSGDEIAAINRVLFEGTSPSHVLETLSTWASSIGNPLVHPKTASPELRATLLGFPSWEPLIDGPITTPAGFAIHCAHSPAAILHEGDTFGHCAGKYPNRALYYAHQTFSIRSKNGWPLATAVFRLNGRQLETWDFRTYKNDRPGAKTTHAARWFYDGINSGRIKVNWAAVEDGQARRWAACGGPDTMTDRYRWNIYDARLREWVWQAFFRRWTPACYREEDLATFLDHSRLLRFVDTLTQMLTAADRSAPVASRWRLSGDWHMRI